MSKQVPHLTHLMKNEQELNYHQLGYDFCTQLLFVKWVRVGIR